MAIDGNRTSLSIVVYGANYWPESMDEQTYYRPVERGFERQVIERMAWWDRKRRERSGG